MRRLYLYRPSFHYRAMPLDYGMLRMFHILQKRINIFRRGTFILAQDDAATYYELHASTAKKEGMHAPRCR